MTVTMLVQKLLQLPQDIEVVYRPYGAVNAHDMEDLQTVSLHEQEGLADRVAIGS